MKWLLALTIGLKIIGIFLLTIFVILVLLMLVALLCGIKYEAKGKYNSVERNAAGFISYLFGLVRVEFSYENNSLDYRLKIPFFTLDRSNGKRILKKIKADVEKADEPERTVSAMSSTEKGQAETDNTKTAEVKSDNSSKRVRKSKKKDKAKKNAEKRNKPDKKKGLLHKIITYYKEYDLKSLYPAVKRFIKKMCRAVGIKEAFANVVFGFDDPSLTGMVLGGGAAFAAFVPFKLNLSGFFEGEYLDADGKVKGKTRLIALLVPLVGLVVEKPVWNLIMKLKG